MIVTFLRSSSLGSFKMCEHQYYLEYELGIKKATTKKMEKGTIVHRALELLAQSKLAEQMGRTFIADEVFGTVDICVVTPQWALEKAYSQYTEASPELLWYQADFRECNKWMMSALTWGPNHRFDPRNRNIVAAEKFFDLTIQKDWALYKYDLPNGETVEGYLGLKGTIDLIVRDERQPGILEIIDWKTGLRKDWSKDGNKKKSYEDLQNDTQLRLYHYAASQLYPEAEEIFVTIFYIQDGGPFSLCYERSDLADTEEVLRGLFNRIHDTEIPKLRAPWYGCTSFCYFGKTRSREDPSKTICQYYADKVRQEGRDLVTHKHGNPGSYLRYRDGAGKKEIRDDL